VEWLEVVFVATILGGIGLVVRDSLTRPRRVRRRVVYYLLLVVAAFASPTPDAIGMLWIWLPAIALFEVGYFVYRRSR
jgi:Sec-independent protein secretion pathway component TatC